MFIKCLADFTDYAVEDFRRNPILRAKVEEEYEIYFSIKAPVAQFG